KKKVYINIAVKTTNNENNYFSVQKTGNHRMVNGYKCYQWRVKNKHRNTEIVFWVANNNFYFFEQLVKILNKTNEDFKFYSRITESYGFFPMLTVERTLLRKEKSRIEVLQITNEDINNSVFNIPSEYKKIIRY
ncbi:MAG: DUF4412 domain-containing protein, partial [Bacteroidales bacterium]|nr:DUF4412 domain-containing protein [Bacteroidales bacterium]